MNIAEAIRIALQSLWANKLRSVLTLLGENPRALVIAQHAPRLKLQESYGALQRTRVLTHGDNALSFYGQSEDGARPSD